MTEYPHAVLDAEEFLPRASPEAARRMLAENPALAFRVYSPGPAPARERCIRYHVSSDIWLPTKKTRRKSR